MTSLPAWAVHPVWPSCRSPDRHQFHRLDELDGSRCLVHSCAGVRVPDHGFTREVCRRAGGALALTSANLSGSTSPLQVRLAAVGMCIAAAGIPRAAHAMCKGDDEMARASRLLYLHR